jgi:hypothetical protein
MNTSEVKQVGQIHALLTAPIDGADEEGNIADVLVFDESLKTLTRRLKSKNTKPLVFVCNDLHLNASPNAKKIVKNDWVEALVQWISKLPLM